MTDQSLDNSAGLPIPPTVPPTPKPPVNSKFLVIAVTIFIVLTSLLTLLSLKQSRPEVDRPLEGTITNTPVPTSPSPNPTANWKTYTNNIYKYSFKYPPNFTLSLFKDYNPPELGVFTTNPEKSITIAFTEPTGSLSGNSSTNELSKVSGLIFKVLGKDYSPSEAYYNNVYKKYVFRIYPISPETTMGIDGEYISENDLNIINQILSTFKFLDQKNCNNCPYYSPPHPDWCKDGKVVPADPIYHSNGDCYCSSPPKCERPGDNIQSLCESTAGGKWLAEYNECEGIESRTCSQLLNGTFEECASACRHNPKAEVCTQNCVPVCTVK